MKHITISALAITLVGCKPSETVSNALLERINQQSAVVEKRLDVLEKHAERPQPGRYQISLAKVEVTFENTLNREEITILLDTATGRAWRYRATEYPILHNPDKATVYIDGWALIDTNFQDAVRLVDAEVNKPDSPAAKLRKGNFNIFQRSPNVQTKGTP